MLGTYKKGLLGIPEVWMIYIHENGKYRSFKDIDELTGYLANERSSDK